jgi:hypothetical protein
MRCCVPINSIDPRAGCLLRCVRHLWSRELTSYPQRLSRNYTATVNNGTPEGANVILSYLCSVLERLLQMSRSPTTDSPIPGLSQSCRLAGCLHVFTPMSGYFPDPTLMLHQLVRDLKSSLTYMIRAVGTRSELLLWLLSVGGITAHSMPERTWFVGHLVVVITDLGIKDWPQMRQHLIQLACTYGCLPRSLFETVANPTTNRIQFTITSAM